MQAAACLVVVLRRLHPLPPAAAILHLAARLGAALHLAVGEPQQPHRRPPAPIGEEIGGQHRHECGGVGVAVDVGPPPTALGLLPCPCAAASSLGGQRRNAFDLDLDLDLDLSKKNP